MATGNSSSRADGAAPPREVECCPRLGQFVSRIRGLRETIGPVESRTSNDASEPHRGDEGGSVDASDSTSDLAGFVDDGSDQLVPKYGPLRSAAPGSGLIYRMLREDTWMEYVLGLCRQEREEIIVAT